MLKYKELYEQKMNLINNKCSKKDLEKYAWMFINSFQETWNWSDWKYFWIDIYVWKNTIWMNFKVIKENQENPVNFIKIKEKNLKEEKETISHYIWIDLKKDKELMNFTKNSFFKISWNSKLFWNPIMAINDIQLFVWEMMFWEKQKKK